MEASANLAKDLKVLAPYGRVVIIGSRAEASFDPIDAILLDANILAMTLYKVPDDDMKAIQAYLKLGLKAGGLRPIVGEEMPLKEAPRAHEALMRPNSYGKIVLIP
jgi:NADPH2:quinone reductase